jgi:hypothetical protein
MTLTVYIGDLSDALATDELEPMIPESRDKWVVR